VMQRKATIEEIKRVSTKNLPGLSEIQRQNSIKQLQKEIGVALDVPAEDNQAETSMTYSMAPQEHVGNISGAGEGHGGKQGGAGVLPVNNKTINIVSPFTEEDGAKNWTREVSQVSYIYGDEDSQHDDHHHGMKQIRMAVITPSNHNNGVNGAEAGAPEQEQSEQWSQPLSFSDDLEKQEQLGVDIKYGHERFDSADDVTNGAAVKNYHVTPLHVAQINTHAPPAMESVASTSPRDDQILKQL